MSVEKCGVYKIVCWQTDKFYIGSSKQIYRHWYQHRIELRRGTSCCRYLQHAWTKYGEESFHFSIVEECDKELLECREQFFIDTLKPKYNLVTNVKRRTGPKVQAKRTKSLRARSARITHCPKGHPYDEKNTKIGKNGLTKFCKRCNADRAAEHYQSLTPEQKEERKRRGKIAFEKRREHHLAKMREYGRLRRAERPGYKPLFALRID